MDSSTYIPLIFFKKIYTLSEDVIFHESNKNKDPPPQAAPLPVERFAHNRLQCFSISEEIPTFGPKTD